MLSDNLGAPMRCWKIIAEKLSTAGLSWGCSSEIAAIGRVLYTADAHRKTDGDSRLSPTKN